VPLATKSNDIFIAFRGEQFPRMLQRRSFNLHAIIVSYRTSGALFLFVIFLLLSHYSWNAEEMSFAFVQSRRVC